MINFFKKQENKNPPPQKPPMSSSTPRKENIEKSTENDMDSDEKRDGSRKELKTIPKIDRKPQDIVDPETGENITVRGAILSIEGNPEHPGKQAENMIVYTDADELFVSKSQIDYPQVKSYIASLDAKRKKYTLIEVSLRCIKLMYDQVDIAGQSSNKVKYGADTNTRRKFIAWIAKAAETNASDVHMTMNKTTARVEFRVDGNMNSMGDLPAEEAKSIMAATYTLADDADASYQELEYQAARLSSGDRVSLPSGVQALRIQWNPLANQGRYMVCRLLYAGKRDNKDLDALGYSSGQLKLIKHMRQIPIGINIISGPTGSGKSTTLKTALQALIREKRGEVNVITVEDPPEYVIEGAKQMPVTNTKTAGERSAAFQKAIGASLRSDPSVIMIGEIRDKESAKLAFEGAMTGHQIWTTLHTNSAIGIIDRLKDLGVEEFKLFDPSTVTGLVGQRLVPLLCPHCKIKLDEAEELGLVDETVYDRANLLISSLGGSHTNLALYYRGEGCKKCQKGYAGRTVVAEIIIPDVKFVELLAEGKKIEARKYWLTEMSMPYKLTGATMLAHAISKMLKGELGPADIEREVGLLIYEEWMNPLFDIDSGRSEIVMDRKK